MIDNIREKLSTERSQYLNDKQEEIIRDFIRAREGDEDFNYTARDYATALSILYSNRDFREKTIETMMK